ncbi:MAG: sugar MFS transporter [Bacteroidota bacterium]
MFFLCGFITVLVDSLIPRLRELFTLSYFEAGLVQFAFFGAYFLLSIPAGYMLSKIGYKKGIILGLLTMGLGCLLFYPAASFRTFGIFILAYFVLAGGMTILQVAANPYVSVLGDEAGASSRLNLSQAFNSLGTAIAPAVGALFILSSSVKSSEEIAQLSDAARESYYATEAAAVQTPFIGLAIFIAIIAVVFAFARLPKIINEKSEGTYKQALQTKSLPWGVLGIFFYVGAEVAIGSYLINYFLDLQVIDSIRGSSGMMDFANFIATIFNKSLAGADDKAILGIFVICYWSGAMVGRFIGSYLTRIIQPAKVLTLFALLAISAIFISVMSTGLIAMWSILAVGLFNSIMFPTIFTTAIDGLGDLKPKASGLLCTAIVGGAVIPPLYGLCTDMVGFKTALLLVMACYSYIVFYGWRISKTKAV